LHVRQFCAVLTAESSLAPAGEARTTMLVGRVIGEPSKSGISITEDISSCTKLRKLRRSSRTVAHEQAAFSRRV
jgi:hypothetical protein